MGSTLVSRVHLALSSFLAVLASSCSTTDVAILESPSSRFELIVLGTAQDGGLPHVGCDQVCCESARRSGHTLYPTSLAIHDFETGKLALIEATPGIEPQLDLLHRITRQSDRGRRPVDAVLLTHAHIGHYLGLAQFGFEVASTDAIPVFVSPSFAEYLRANGPWSQLVEMGQIELVETRPGQAFSPLPGIQVTPVAVPHRDEFSDTVGFRIHGPTRTVLFVPDVDAWHRETGLLETLLEGVDLAFLDATFYDGRELPGRDLTKVLHPFMTDTMDRLGAQALLQPGRIRFIHMNHTNPVLLDEALLSGIQARGFDIARRGDRVEL